MKFHHRSVMMCDKKISRARKSHQTRSCHFTEQEPKRDDKEAILFRVDPDLKDQRRAPLDFCTHLAFTSMYWVNSLLAEIMS